MILFVATLVHPAAALVLGGVARVHHPSPVLKASALPRRSSAARLAIVPSEPPPELPTPALLKAIARCGSVATAADVAVEAGLEIEEARRQLLSLARLVGAELQVSERGELLFVFDSPGELRGQLRSASVRQRVKDTWSAASPPFYWMMRATFGLGLLASLTLVTVAITTLAASSKDGERSSGSSMPSVGALWGPSPLDFLYYSTRPYGYYGYGGLPSEEKGFLQSCFSLLFGDGDPNANLPQRTSIAAAALIRANNGAVTAEQLAPLLNPAFGPDEYAEEAARPGAPVREDWMLPLLLQFNGEPVVTEAGDLIYRFPELMSTAAAAATPRSLPAGRIDKSAAEAAASLRAALAFPEAPPGWRPVVGDAVYIAQVLPTRGRDDAMAQAWLGLEALVVSDDRDGLPFGVYVPPSGGSTRAFREAEGAARPRANGYFALRELAPKGSVDLGGGGSLVPSADAAADAGVALQELPQPYSTAPPGQLVAAGTLGVANLAGVLYIGRVLASVSGVPTAYLGSAGPMVGLLRKLYLPLLVYATGFVVTPAVRAVRNRRVNRRIGERNRRRSEWARAVGGSDVIEAAAESADARGGALADASADDGAYSREERRGLRVALRRKLGAKLQAARALAPRLQRFRRATGDADDADSTFSTARSVDENKGSAASAEGGGFDDFDRRLGLTDGGE